MILSLCLFKKKKKANEGFWCDHASSGTPFKEIIPEKVIFLCGFFKLSQGFWAAQCLLTVIFQEKKKLGVFFFISVKCIASRVLIFFFFYINRFMCLWIVFPVSWFIPWLWKLSFPFFNSLICQHLKMSVLRVLVKKPLVFLSVGKERISTVKLLNFNWFQLTKQLFCGFKFFWNKAGYKCQRFFFPPTENFPDGYLNPQIICPSCKSAL